MWYAMFAEDDPERRALRPRLRSEHRRRLDALRAEGRLRLAAPWGTTDAVVHDPEAATRGSLVVAAFSGLEEAQEWWARDPYVVEGLYARWNVYPLHLLAP
jgi:uncharacterized protein YciI